MVSANCSITVAQIDNNTFETLVLNNYVGGIQASIGATTPLEVTGIGRINRFAIENNDFKNNAVFFASSTDITFRVNVNVGQFSVTGDSNAFIVKDNDFDIFNPSNNNGNFPGVIVRDTNVAANSLTCLEFTMNNFILTDIATCFLIENVENFRADSNDFTFQFANQTRPIVTGFTVIADKNDIRFEYCDNKYSSNATSEIFYPAGSTFNIDLIADMYNLPFNCL